MILTVQGTLKSLLQHNSKASILQCSAFFVVQLTHPYMTTEKNHGVAQSRIRLKRLSSSSSSNFFFLKALSVAATTTAVILYMPSHFSPIQLFATPWTIVYRLPCPWDSPGKNTGVGYHAPLQGIFLTQGLNLHLLHCRQILYC